MRQREALLLFLFVRLHRDERQSVVSATGLLYVEIDEHGVDLPRYLLRAGGEVGDLVEEGYFVLYLRVRPLVLDEAAEEGFAFGIPLQQSAHGLLHLYLLGVPTTAQLAYQRGEVPVLYLLVNLRPLLRIPIAHADFLIPLPAAQVAEQHEDVLPLGGDAFGQLAVQHFHAAEHLLVRDAQALEGFDEDVAEVPVEGSLYAEDFLLALFGEGTKQVLADEPAPIPYYIIYDRVGQVAHEIEHTQRQSGQEPHQVVPFPCPVLVHSSSINVICPLSSRSRRCKVTKNIRVYKRKPPFYLQTRMQRVLSPPLEGEGSGVG